MKNAFSFFIKSSLLLISFIAIERFCHKQTRGFTLLKIASNSPVATQEEIPSYEQRQYLDSLLNQPFTFLNSGGQCYAFVSRDGETIIKFFKHHHIRLWQWLKKMPLPQFLEPFRKKLLKAKKHQSPLFLESCKIAYHHFKERTGLIYLHVNSTHYFKRKITIIDKLGIAHLIDLDKTDFAIQKKAELSHNTFRKLIKDNHFYIAKECLDSLIALIIERCQKGINDRDPNMRRNIGFLGTQAIEIDLGSFTQEDKLKNQDYYKIELIKKTQKFHKWLSKQNEMLSLYLAERLNAFQTHVSNSDNGQENSTQNQR